MALAGLFAVVATSPADDTNDDVKFDRPTPDELDDIEILTCRFDPETQVASARVRVTNDSSWPDEYDVSIAFTLDGEPRTARADGLRLHRVAPGRSRTNFLQIQMDENDEGEDVSCDVNHVRREASR